MTGTDDPDGEDIPMPEYPTCTNKSAEIAGHVIQWLSDSSYDESVAQLSTLSEMYVLKNFLSYLQSL